MIVRAKPKFIIPHFFDEINVVENLDTDGYYFNTGSNGICFLLKMYSLFLNKKLNVALQSFNCSVVIDAVLNSGNKASLYDIKLTDFSIDFHEFKNDCQDIDVLILTHYQGIPNSDYLQISDFCKQREILLIDDLAHVDKIYIDSIQVGTKANVIVYSFAFDKPYSCYKGGELRFVDVLPDFKLLLDENYLRLSEESCFTENTDIKTLKFLCEYCNENKFDPKLDYRNAIWVLIVLRFSNKFIYKFIKKSPHIFLRAIAKLSSSFAKNTIRKLGNQKRQIISFQRTIAAKGFSYNIPLYLKNYFDSTVQWNRFVVLDELNEIRKELEEKDLQIGNFNWPTPLHVLFDNNKHVTIVTKMDNSEYVSKNILNIPIWQFISLKYNDK